MFETQKKMITKAVHSTLGAPVVARKVAGEYVSKASEYADRLVDRAQARYDQSAAEGEKIAKRFQDGVVVEEIQQRVDMDKVQDRVGKLRDQLEAALDSWRENFNPETRPAPKKVEVEAVKIAAKKTPAKKPAAAKKTTTARSTAAKKPAAKKTTAKASTAKKPAAKSTAAKGTAAKKPAAKKTTTAKSAAAKKTTTARKPATTAKK